LEIRVCSYIEKFYWKPGSSSGTRIVKEVRQSKIIPFIRYRDYALKIGVKIQ